MGLSKSRGQRNTLHHRKDFFGFPPKNLWWAQSQRRRRRRAGQCWAGWAPPFLWSSHFCLASRLSSESTINMMWLSIHNITQEYIKLREGVQTLSYPVGGWGSRVLNFRWSFWFTCLYCILGHLSVIYSPKALVVGGRVHYFQDPKTEAFFLHLPLGKYCNYTFVVLRLDFVFHSLHPLAALLTLAAPSEFGSLALLSFWQLTSTAG